MLYQIGSGAKYGYRFFVSYSSAVPTVANLTTLANEIATLHGSDLSSLLISGANLVEVDVADLSSAPYPVGRWTGSQAGANSGSELPASASVVLTLHIGRSYRGGHPRIYLPFGVESDLANVQSWTSTFLANVTSGWTSFMSSLIAYSGDSITKGGQINVSFYGPPPVVITSHSGRVRNASTPRTTPLHDTILAITAQPRIGSQRRRISM